MDEITIKKEETLDTAAQEKIEEISTSEEERIRANENRLTNIERNVMDISTQHYQKMDEIWMKLNEMNDRLSKTETTADQAAAISTIAALTTEPEVPMEAEPEVKSEEVVEVEKPEEKEEDREKKKTPKKSWFRRVGL